MTTITPRALALLFRAKGDNEMIHVNTQDNTGYAFSGRVLRVDGDTFDIEDEDGDVIYDVQVRRISHVAVCPLKKYTGYSAAQFVNDVVSGSGWNR